MSISSISIRSPGTSACQALKAKLVKARAAGRLPKVVVPVHFGGQATDQEAIHGPRS